MMVVEVRHSEKGEGYFRCRLVKGRTIMFEMPPVTDGVGRALDLSGPEVDFMAEYDGCNTPGEALEVFGRALDAVLAKWGWKRLHDAAEAEDGSE
jgi:hypothetical protein